MEISALDTIKLETTSPESVAIKTVNHPHHSREIALIGDNLWHHNSR